MNWNQPAQSVWCPKGCGWRINEPCRNCARAALDRHIELKHPVVNDDSRREAIATRKLADS